MRLVRWQWHPADPVLRRAGWAVVVYGETGFLTVGQGQCPGRQTVGRAELAALVWVSRCEGDCRLVTDSMYVRNGALAHSQHNLAQLLHGPDADLWALVAKRVSVTWIRSHLALEAALGQGFSRRDWLGNQAADVAAGCAARAHAVTAAQRAGQGARLQAAAILHRTIAAVEEAALIVNHAAGSAIVRRRKARRRQPRKMLQAKRAVPKRPAVPRNVMDEGPPPGVHLLTPVFGPVPETVANSPATRPVSWGVQCLRCARTALGTGRWTSFAKTTCPAELVGMPRHENRLHHLARVPNGWCCLRCDLGVSSARRAAAAVARCLVPELVSAAGVDLLAARPWLSRAVRLAHEWRLFARVGSAGRLAPVPPPPPPEASAAAACAVGSVGLRV